LRIMAKLCKLLTIAIIPDVVSAWSTLKSSTHYYTQHRRLSFGKKVDVCFQRHAENLPLQASIFSSDSMVIYPSLIEMDDEEDFEDQQLSIHESLKERILSSERDILAPLARLAVAFSPPEHAPRLKDITHIEIINVDEKHIELSAVVSDGQESCISLFVPVTFPHDCGDSLTGDMVETECVLDNIDELDHMAEDKLFAMNMLAEAASREATLDHDLSLSKKDSDIDYPDWWEYPLGLSMIEECSTVEGILNDASFADALVDLAIQGLEYSSKSNMETEAVEKAVLVCLGPAGFYLRARVVYETNGDTKRKIVDVPCPFGIFGTELVADSADDLRAAVLGAVAVAQHLG